MPYPVQSAKKSQVLQVIDILKSGFAIFSNFSGHQKLPALATSDQQSVMAMAKIHVNIIDNFCLILHSRRRWGVS